MIALAGEPLMTGGALAVTGAVRLTRMTNGPTEPVLLPSVAVIVMAPVVPAAALLGVPLNVPVLESKVAHAGRPLTAKVTTPVAYDTVGWNE